ncbi:hypothetical protein EDC04DRAFT_3098194 [Pisolithus marmoratus]|nr:hypothetical protein EDC04DRAFT_3098194 [Pisolithus marmoratus]
MDNPHPVPLQDKTAPALTSTRTPDAAYPHAHGGETVRVQPSWLRERFSRSDELTRHSRIHNNDANGTGPSAKSRKLKSEHSTPTITDDFESTINLHSCTGSEPCVDDTIIRVKKKAKSRANSDDERAMDELYALEREEALRRAEYEARHAEALRRAEYEARKSDVIYIHGRPSKSATTSPVSTPYHTATPLKPVDGVLMGTACHARRTWQDDDETSRMMGKTGRVQRRMSGPAWQMTPMTRNNSTGQPPAGTSMEIPLSMTTSSSGTPPDQVRSSTLVSRHLSTHEDSPSPLSSDSDTVPPSHHHSTHQTSYRRTHPVANPNSSAGPAGPGSELSPPSRSASKPEFTFTPSTSPFLGPFRGEGSASPVDGSLHGSSATRQRRRGSSIVGSPPGTRVAAGGGAGAMFGPGSRNKSFGDMPYSMSTIPHVHTYPGQLSLAASQASRRDADRKTVTSAVCRAAQVVVVVEAVREVRYILRWPLLGELGGRRFEIGVPTKSPPISRSGSPHYPPRHGSGHTNGQYPLQAQSQTQVPSQAHGTYHHHHYLAHSVRSAFGMTPIYHNSNSSSGGGASNGTSMPQRNPSWPVPCSHPHTGPVRSGSSPGGVVAPQGPLLAHSLPYDHNYGFGTLGSASVPPSRAPSPPITLPPLRLRTTSPRSMSMGEGESGDDEDGHENEDEDMEGEGVVIGRKRDRSRRGVPVDKEKVALPGFKEIEAVARGEK